MPILKPFRRNCRQFTDGSYFEGGKGRYIEHAKFSNDPDKYVRALLLIQKDMQENFDYVEPSDINLPCYSYRIHELLLRTCVEVEANLKAILVENGYRRKAADLTMNDYRKINDSHRLSSYKIKIPYWHGSFQIRTPFAAWAGAGSLSWYKAYNITKHDRHEKFTQASLLHATDAICGLVALLSSQFGTNDFGPGDSLLSLGGNGDGFESAIGGYFRVQFPTDWPADARYAFSYQDWTAMEANEIDPFQQIAYL